MTGLTELASAAAQKYRTTPALVRDVLRDAILRGIFKGGEQLRQDEVAAQFGVSRIPVREALQQLEAEGLVTLSPHRGAMVSVLSSEEVEEIYLIRIPLEAVAIRLSVPRLTRDDLAKAAEILDAIDEETEVARWGELNRMFHATLYIPAGRPRLLSMIGTLRANVDRYLRIYISLMQYKPRSQREHREILKACMRRDVRGAVEALEQHLGNTGKLLAAYLREQGRSETTRDARFAIGRVKE